MNITPRTPKTPFDFGAAVTQLFTTSGGMPWALRLIGVTGVLLGLTYAIGGFFIAAPYLELLGSLDEIETDPTAAVGSLRALIPGYILLLIGPFLVLVMAETTLHRAVLRNEDTLGFPLRFGKDELRVLGASLSVWILAFLAFFGAVFVGAVIGGLIAVAVGAIGALIIGLAYIAGLAIWPFVAIRLAPASALTVYNEQAHVMAGRHISKHRFWSLFLAFLVVGFVGYVGNSIISLIGMSALIGDGSMFLASGGALGDGSGTDIAQTLRDKFSNPLVIIGSIIGVIIYSCFVAAWLLSMAGIGSYAVKWWAEEDQASPFD